MLVLGDEMPGRPTPVGGSAGRVDGLSPPLGRLPEGRLTDGRLAMPVPGAGPLCGNDEGGRLGIGRETDGRDVEGREMDGRAPPRLGALP
jgi:hypothetical protein